MVKDQTRMIVPSLSAIRWRTALLPAEFLPPSDEKFSLPQPLTTGPGLRPADENLRPAVFLDRDGVIIEDREDFIKSWEEVVLVPGALEALRRLADSAYVVVLVTNQSAVGRGIIRLEQAQQINRQIIDLIRAAAGRIDASYFCPHAPDEGCTCRKPAPGMLLGAAAELDLDLSRSYLVGDKASDVKAAENAGAQGILVRTGKGEAHASLLPEGRYPIVADLAAAVQYIASPESERSSKGPR